MNSKTSFKDRMLKMNKSLFNRHEGRYLKAAAAALIITTLTYNFAFAEEDTEHKFKQIYHIYLSDEYIGAVYSQKKIDNLIALKEKEASIQYKELIVDASANIKVIPELVYKSAIDADETMDKLKDELVVEAQAFEVKVSGETIAYVKDAKEYEEVLNKLKLQYVTQEELDKFNANQQSGGELPALAINETRITGINIKENIEVEETKVKPEQVLNVEQTVELLTSGSLEKVSYKVQQGDVLGSIASKHNLKLRELLDLNPGINENTLLKIGQELNVTAVKPILNIEVIYEKLAEEEISFQKVVKEDNTILKGETKVTQKGANGKKETVYKLVNVNGQRTAQQVVSETVKSEPVDEIVVKGTKVIPSRGNGTFSWPTNGGYISSTMGSRWGSYHRGIDIARPSNYTIKAADNGTVTFAGWDGTYGQKVVVNHNNGFQTVYAHLSSFNVHVGQVVQTGSPILRHGVYDIVQFLHSNLLGSNCSKSITPNVSCIFSVHIFEFTLTFFRIDDCLT